MISQKVMNFAPFLHHIVEGMQQICAKMCILKKKRENPVFENGLRTK